MNGPAPRPGAPVAIVPGAVPDGGPGPVWYVALPLLAVCCAVWGLLSFLLALGGRPGVDFQRRAQRAASGLSTDIGQAFIVGFAERGPTDAYSTVTSIDELADDYGSSRSGVYAALYDEVETALAEGAATVHVVRVAGGAAAVATLTLDDGSAVATIRLDARSVGEWANGASGGYSAAVAAGSTSGKKVTISFDGDVVETHDDVGTVEAIVDAVNAGDHLAATDLASASGDPLPANLADTDLAGGTDDNAAATDDDWQAALDLLPRTLGPGQVMEAGRYSAAAWAQLLDHAEANNRTALVTLAARSASKTTLTTNAAAYYALAHAERGLPISSWVKVAQAVPGVDRWVPATALFAGAIARRDATGDRAWPLLDTTGWSLAVDTEWSANDLTDLTAAGVNTARKNPATNRPQVYGFFSGDTDSLWHDAAHQRLFMELEARALNHQEGFVGQPIVQETIDAYGAALEGECLRLYASGALDGRDPVTGIVAPANAFRVDVGPGVNTAATAAARELVAVVWLRFSEHVEVARTIAIKVPVTSAIAA